MSWPLPSPTRVLLCAAALSGCDAHGVSIGSEQLCTKDPRLLAAEQAGSEQVSSCAEIGDNLVQNPGFEAPLVESCASDLSFCQFPAADVPSWSTDSPEQVTEIWSSGHQGVEAAEGSQFAELDARSRDTLSQDVALPPGQLVYWALLHRGRTGIDSMELQLGPPDALRTQATLSSAEDRWYHYSGLYRVGDDETLTRLSLVSRSGDMQGNFVDAVELAPVIAP
jgi:hypothetical protein